MRFGKIMILVLVIISCRSNYESILEVLPVKESSFRFEQNNWNFEPTIDLRGTGFFEVLKEEEPTIEKASGIAKFEISEMDTFNIRPFELILIDVIKGKRKERLLITIQKTDKSIIDIFTFNPDTMSISAIYPHSSKLDHDGIAIELIVDHSKNGIPKIIGYYVEVFETGKIEAISRSENELETFRRLLVTKKHTGSYQFKKDELKINFDLKDGIGKGMYAYELKIDSPDRCINVYRKLACKLTGGVLKIDSIGDFIVSFTNGVRLRNMNYETGCEEILQLDYELKGN